MQAAILAGGKTQVGSVGGMLGLIEFQFLAGGERKAVERIARGVEMDASEFLPVKDVTGKDAREQRAEFAALQLRDAGRIERFFLGDVIAGRGHSFTGQLAAPRYSEYRAWGQKVVQTRFGWTGIRRTWF